MRAAPRSVSLSLAYLALVVGADRVFRWWPAYLNWNLGVTFERGNLHFDLRYFDSNLSKASCFVLTGDPNATAGGPINPLTNPRGLESNWCSATLVAKFWFALN
jgi:hypothetical protein